MMSQMPLKTMSIATNVPITQRPDTGHSAQIRTPKNKGVDPAQKQPSPARGMKHRARNNPEEPADQKECPHQECQRHSPRFGMRHHH